MISKEMFNGFCDTNQTFQNQTQIPFGCAGHYLLKHEEKISR